MKSKALGILFLLAISITGNTQNIKINMGVSYSSFLGRKDAAMFKKLYKPKLGTYVSGAVKILGKNKLSLWSGLSFISNGFRTEVNGGTYSSKETINLNYFNIPINLRADIPIGTNKLYGQVGLYGGLAVFGNSLLKSNGNKQRTSVRIGGENGFQRFDYGLNSAIGMQIGKLDIQLNYLHGLADVSVGKNKKDDFILNNQSLRFSVGYYFGRSKS